MNQVVALVGQSLHLSFGSKIQIEFVNFATEFINSELGAGLLNTQHSLPIIGDQKANILLSINAIILTIRIPVFASRFNDYHYLAVPALCFLITCITTMAFAALATRPAKMDGETDLSRIRSGNTDLFFFGNFFGIEQDDYQTAIRAVLSKRDLLDDSIINHLYFLGQNLGVKYTLLRRSYTIFIIGFIITVLALVVSYIVKFSF